MPARTQDQQEILNSINALDVNDIYIYTGAKTCRQVCALVHNWSVRKELNGVYKTFTWDGKLYVIRVRPKTIKTSPIGNQTTSS